MRRRCLFLQGPHGPFFKELGQKLAAQGDRVLRVNFNGGDWYDWHGPDTISFTGKQRDWAGFVARLYQNYLITDLFLYGDCRSLHRIAIDLAKRQNIKVHVFEEGYIRPNWITYEQDGVNGNSPLLAERDKLLLESVTAPAEDAFSNAEKVGPSTRWILRYCFHYYFYKSILHLKYRNYTIHRPYRPYQELLASLGTLLHAPLSLCRTWRRRKNLFQSGHAFYLVCLQLDSDAQVRVHSNYLSMADFIGDVLRSFARYAPKNKFLVFKRHPHEPGLIPYETLVRLEAYSLGIRDRVRFLHTGSLPELIKASDGVVLMNSTVGTSSLHHGKPTVVLGKAIYDMPGLTWQDGLDRFWREAVAPDQRLYKVFRSMLFKEALIHGGFYSAKGRKLALQGVLSKIQENRTMPKRKQRSNKVVTLHEPQRRAVGVTDDK